MCPKTDEYKALATERAKSWGKERDGRVYELGDKAGKLLAWLDKREGASWLVPELKTYSGEKVRNPALITGVFVTHFSAVYTSHSPLGREDSVDLLTDIGLPSLSEDDQSYFDSEMTKDEIVQAIRTLNG